MRGEIKDSGLIWAFSLLLLWSLPHMGSSFVFALGYWGCAMPGNLGLSVGHCACRVLEAPDNTVFFCGRFPFPFPRKQQGEGLPQGSEFEWIVVFKGVSSAWLFQSVSPFKQESDTLVGIFLW